MNMLVRREPWLEESVETGWVEHLDSDECCLGTSDQWSPAAWVCHQGLPWEDSGHRWSGLSCGGGWCWSCCCSLTVSLLVSLRTWASDTLVCSLVAEINNNLDEKVNQLELVYTLHWSLHLHLKTKNNKFDSAPDDGEVRGVQWEDSLVIPSSSSEDDIYSQDTPADAAVSVCQPPLQMVCEPHHPAPSIWKYFNPVKL